MLPVAYICLDKFPLTTNGKVDRKALPTADLIKYQSVEYIAPRNAQEQAISQIISSVLNLEKVGIDHNFFEIGGNSLNATQVVLSIHQTFGVKLPLRSLLESPTVKEIAVSIEQILATIQKIQSTPVDLSADREEIEL
jgi:acyl carrier protein